MALLPTLITLGNGVCGFAAILQIGLGMSLSENQDLLNASHFRRAAWLILAAMIFDALDGLVARMTRTASTFGAQLDSLCDLVTFGVAPAFLVFAVSRGGGERIVLAVSVLYAMCALIRLARFTVETVPDESAHKEFAGLPSPAAAGVIAAAVLPCHALRDFPALAWVAKIMPVAPPVLAFAMGILMVSRIRYVHVVNQLLRGTRSFVTLVELTLLAALAYLFNEFAVFLTFFGYAVTGPAIWMKNRLTRRPAPDPSSAPLHHPERDESLF